MNLQHFLAGKESKLNSLLIWASYIIAMHCYNKCELRRGVELHIALRKNCEQQGSGPREETGEWRPGLTLLLRILSQQQQHCCWWLKAGDGQCQSDCGDSRVSESLSDYWRALT